MSNNIKIARLSLIMHSRIITSNFPTFLFTNIRVRRVCPLLTREGALAGATRMTRERERGGTWGLLVHRRSNGVR